LSFFGSFAHHFQIKLSTHGINLNSIFIIMSELKFFLLTVVLTQNFNTMDLVNYFWKKNKNFTFRSWRSLWRWHHAKPIAKFFFEKKWKSKILWAKQTFFLAPFNLWAVSATWLHVGGSLENTGKMNLILVLNKTTPRARRKSDLGVLGIHGKLAKYVVYSSKRKNWKKIIFLHTSCPNNNWPVFDLKKF
jgi:hypothetical protein